MNDIFLKNALAVVNGSATCKAFRKLKHRVCSVKADFSNIIPIDDKPLVIAYAKQRYKQTLAGGFCNEAEE